MKPICRLPMLFAMSCAIALVLGACGNSGGPASSARSTAAVKSIEFGSSVNEGNQQVIDPTNMFTPSDTIYATVTTTGPGLDGDETRVDADWIYQNGQVVSHSSHKGHAGASMPDLFSASAPQGFRPGKYALEIKFDGTPAAVKEFTVKEVN